MTKNEKTAVFENFAQQAARRMEEKKKHRKERLKIKSMGDTEIEIRGLSDKELNECFEFSEEPLEVDRYTIYYASQTLQEAAKILISNINKRLKEKNLSLMITEEALEYVVSHGSNIEYGARPLKRYIQQEIEDQIAEKILLGQLNSDGAIVIDADENGLNFTNENPA